MLRLGTAIIYKETLHPITIEKEPEGKIIKIIFDHFTIINVYGYPDGSLYKTEKKNDFLKMILPF